VAANGKFSEKVINSGEKKNEEKLKVEKHRFFNFF